MEARQGAERGEQAEHDAEREEQAEQEAEPAESLQPEGGAGQRLGCPRVCARACPLRWVGGLHTRIGIEGVLRNASNSVSVWCDGQEALGIQCV
eukprot:9058388-Alexandrium_andersonii.AAC.1